VSCNKIIISQIIIHAPTSLDIIPLFISLGNNFNFHLRGV
jgi:hypothetical protein